jgi:hypothetical protein
MTTAFLTMEELNLPATRVRQFRAAGESGAARLPAVTGISVNTVHGNTRSIAGVTARFHPQVESMEGAGVHVRVPGRRVPFAQVRAVSNVVEQRNRAPGRWPKPSAASAARARDPRSRMNLSLGFSPCPNDCFMFDAIVNRASISRAGVSVRMRTSRR